MGNKQPKEAIVEEPSGKRGKMNEEYNMYSEGCIFDAEVLRLMTDYPDDWKQWHGPEVGSLLDLAIWKGDEYMKSVKMLLEQGVLPSRCVIYSCVLGGSEGLLQFFLERGVKNIDYERCFETLVKTGKCGMLDSILSREPKEWLELKRKFKSSSESAERVIQFNGEHCVQMLRVLEKHGIPVADGEASAQVPLCRMVLRADNDACLRFFFEDEGRKKMLLGYRDEGNNSLLHIAAEINAHKCAEVLIVNGIDANHKNKQDVTPVTAALENGAMEVMTILAGVPTVFSWHWGQDNDCIVQNLPKPMCFLPNATPVGFSSGNQNHLLLTDGGRLYSWGNSSYGKLGHPEQRDRKGPSPIKALSKQHIIQIACGDSHSLAVDETGSVFAWGNGADGRLGIPNLNQTTRGYGTALPMALESLARVTIVQVAAGREHSLLLDKNGAMYSFGKAMFGRLGLGSGESVHTPTLIEGTEPMTGISCGNFHSLSIGRSGKAFSWGWGKGGRLGLGDDLDRVHPTPISENLPLVSSACAGGNFSMFLSNGTVYTCGENDRGQLGYNGSRNLVQVVSLPCKVHKISTGTKHCVVLSEAGEVFSWGDNEMGQLGQRPRKFLQTAVVAWTCIPSRVHLSLDGENDEIAHDISTGANTSMAITGFGLTQLGEDLKNALSNRSHSDVEFEVQGTSFHLHKCILACRCPLLLKTLDGTPGQKIVLEDTSAEVFKSLAEYLYTDRIGETAAMKGLFELATTYNIPRLQVMCAKETLKMPKSTVADDFMICLKSALYPDITFKVENEAIQAHKVVLCARSEYFATMFTKGFKESSLEDVLISDCEPATFRDLLQYLYTGTLDIDPTEAVDLFILSGQYQLDRLQYLCEGIIKRNVELETVAYVYKTALMFPNSELIQYCRNMIQKNYKKVTKTDCFQLLSGKEVEELEAHWPV